jgi:hypothetical protein
VKLSYAVDVIVAAAAVLGSTSVYVSLKPGRIWAALLVVWRFIASVCGRSM